MPSLPETGPHMRDLTIDHPDHPMAADRGMFRITRPAAGRSCEIRLRTGRLTATNATAFRDQVYDLIDQGEDRLVVDLAAVDFIDSTAISALGGVLKRLGMRGEIVLCGLSGSVAGMFRITRMDKVCPVFADCAAASAALGGRS